MAAEIEDRAGEGDTVVLLAMRGMCSGRLGQTQQAADLLQAAIDRAAATDLGWETAGWHLERAGCLFDLGDLDGAAAEMDRALADKDVTPEIATGALVSLAAVALRQGRGADAEALHLRALRTALSAADDDGWDGVDLLDPEVWQVETELDEYGEAVAICTLGPTGSGDLLEVEVDTDAVAAVWMAVGRRHLAVDDLADAEAACWLAGRLYEARGSLDVGLAVGLLADIRSELGPSADLLAEQELVLADTRQRRNLAQEAQALASLGQTYLDLRRLDEAGVAFRDLEQLSREQGVPSDVATALVGQAQIAWIRDEHDVATALLTDLLDELPADGAADRARTLMLLGDVERSRRRRPEAVEHYGSARTLFSGLADWSSIIAIERQLANLEIAAREYDVAVERLEAIAPLARSLISPSETAEILADLLSARLVAGDRTAATEAVDEVVRLRREVQVPSTSALLAATLGDMLVELEDFDGAIAAFGDALAVHRRLGRGTGEVAALLRLASALGDAERYDEKLDAADAACALVGQLADPALVREAALYRAFALADLSRHEEAAAITGPLIAAEPDDPLLLTGLAWIELLAGDHAASVAHSERALALDDTQTEALRNLGHALLALRRPDEAERCYRQAIAQRRGGENFAHTIREVRRLLDEYPDLPRGAELLALLEDAQSALA